MRLAASLGVAITAALCGAAQGATAPRLYPHARIPTWTSLDPSTTLNPLNPTVTINCTQPLVAGNYQVDLLDPGVRKITLGPTDTPPGDIGRVPVVQRCEDSYSAFKRDYEIDSWLATQFLIPCGQTYTPGMQFYGPQGHASDDAGDVNPSHPIYAFKLDSFTQLRITYSGSTDDNTTIVDGTAYTDSDFRCGVPYFYVLRLRPSKVGAGQITVYRARKGLDAAFSTVANLSGINMGYNDVVGWYPKEGMYNRGALATNTIIYGRPMGVGYSSMLYLTTSLGYWGVPSQ